MPNKRILEIIEGFPVVEYLISDEPPVLIDGVYVHSGENSEHSVKIFPHGAKINGVPSRILSTEESAKYLN